MSREILQNTIQDFAPEKLASLPLSERSGKKTQYEKGKRILKDTRSDAGIFILIWRISPT